MLSLFTRAMMPETGSGVVTILSQAMTPTLPGTDDFANLTALAKNTWMIGKEWCSPDQLLPVTEPPGPRRCRVPPRALPRLSAVSHINLDRAPGTLLEDLWRYPPIEEPTNPKTSGFDS